MTKNTPNSDFYEAEESTTETVVDLSPEQILLKADTPSGKPTEILLDGLDLYILDHRGILYKPRGRWWVEIRQLTSGIYQVTWWSARQFHHNRQQPEELTT